MNINKELQEYIEKTLFPEYEKNEKGSYEEIAYGE
jgi:hypothetical protein